MKYHFLDNYGVIITGLSLTFNRIKNLLVMRVLFLESKSLEFGYNILGLLDSYIYKDSKIKQELFLWRRTYDIRSKKIEITMILL